jgi:hypothetical protein
MATDSKSRQSRKNVTVKAAVSVDSKEFKDWLTQIYDDDLISPEELKIYYDSFRYIGFNRDEVLVKFYETVSDVKVAVQLIILCALRGPRAASKIKLLNGMTPVEMRISASDGKGTNKLTCARITSATADLAAFYLKRLNISKRMPSHDCPAWLQFPSAGSIKLNDEMRALHLDFTKKFSKVIKGEFNENIYAQMIENSYLDPRLNLLN